MDASQHDDYRMRDQYLELLWTAQKVEDRRLTELILLRLKDMALEMTVHPSPACEIIPFPSIIVQPIGTPADQAHTHPWPREPLRHLLSFVGGYCAVVVFFALFGLASS